MKIGIIAARTINAEKNPNIILIMADVLKNSYPETFVELKPKISKLPQDVLAESPMWPAGLPKKIKLKFFTAFFFFGLCLVQANHRL